RHEGNVQPAGERVAGTDPEIGLALVAEPGKGVAAALLRRHLHHDAVAERRQRPFVELLRAGKVRHPEADVVEHDYTCRSTSVRLRSAMTFAGLRCLGQALEQFRMVWQRYRRNGSSRLSSRAPVASSRESTIQRCACNSAAGPR